MRRKPLFSRSSSPEWLLSYSEFLFLLAANPILLEEAEEWLREEGILFPAESAIHKIIAQVRPQAENQVFAAITKQLSATQAQTLVVTDGHDGLLAAVTALFTATLRQRCVVHKQRNVMNAIPKREHATIATELAGIWKSPTKEEALTQLAAFKGKYQKQYSEAVRSLMEDEEHLLTFYAFPPVMHRYIRTTNAMESFFSNVRQRTDQIDTFTTAHELPDHCLGGDARHPCAEDSCQLTTKYVGMRVREATNRKEWVRERCFVLFAFCNRSLSLFVLRTNCFSSLIQLLFLSVSMHLLSLLACLFSPISTQLSGWCPYLCLMPSPLLLLTVAPPDPVRARCDEAPHR